MTIKILGGVARGFGLKAPPEDLTRPMAATLKRRVFDYFQSLKNVVFVDLCAGSGAVGLEAWSRGAAPVYFFEMAARAYQVLKQNVAAVQEHYPEDSEKRPCHLTMQDCRRFSGTFRPYYEALSTEQQENVVLFFAPPYPEHRLYQDFLEMVKQEGWFRGQVWVESDEQKGPPLSELEKWLHPAVKTYNQGTTFLSLINC